MSKLVERRPFLESMLARCARVCSNVLVSCALVLGTTPLDIGWREIAYALEGVDDAGEAVVMESGGESGHGGQALDVSFGAGDHDYGYRECTLHFEAGAEDAEGSMQDVKVLLKSGADIETSLPVCGFTADGRVFSGWRIEGVLGMPSLDVAGTQELVNLSYRDDGYFEGERAVRDLTRYAIDDVITLVAQWDDEREDEATALPSQLPSDNIEAEVDLYDDEGNADGQIRLPDEAAELLYESEDAGIEFAPLSDIDVKRDSTAYAYRLLVGFRGDVEVRRTDTVLGVYGNACLIGFTSYEELQAAKRQYAGKARFACEDGRFLASANASASEISDVQFPQGAGEVQGNTPLDKLLEDEVQETSDARCTVALVDTGVADRCRVSMRLSVIGEDGSDDNGHGSDMFDTVLLENPDADVMSIKALDSDGSGTVTAVYAAIVRAVECGADVVNLSFAARAADGCPAIEAAIDDAHAAGCAVVAAAGNDGADASGYCPAGVSRAITVGATDDEGRVLPSSNYGPSVDVWVPSPSTSFAAAHVSGKLSKTRGARPWLDALGGLEGVSGEAEGSDGSFALAVEHAKDAVEGIVFKASAHATVTVSAVQVDNDNKNSVTRSATASTSPKSISVSTTSNKRHFKSASASIASNSPGGGVSASLSGGTSHWKTTFKMSFSGNMASAYSSSYTVHGLKKTASGGAEARDGAAATHEGAAIDGIAFKLIPKSYTHSVMARYQTASGTWSGYSQVQSGSYAYQDAVPGWSRNADATYKAASVGGYTAGYTSNVCYVDVYRQSYTASFNGNGGSSGAAITRLTGAALGSLPSSSRTGYTFAGWWTAATGGSQVTTATAMPTGNVTYYAHWNVNSYKQTVKVRYQQADGKYGSYTAVIDENRKYGTTVSWSRAQDATYQAASVSYTVPASAQTKSVDVNRRSYTAKFDANGGSGGSSRVRLVGAALGDLPTPSRSGATFIGWFTASTGGSQVSATTAMPARETTYYAHWDLSDHKVSFDANGGEGEMPAVTAPAGQGCAVPGSSYTRPGFAFSEWSTSADGAGTSYHPGQTITPGADTVLYARWQPVQLSFSVPATISLVLKGNGSLLGPADGMLRFANNGDTGIEVSKMKVIADEGMSVTHSPSAQGEYDVALSPAGGSRISLADFAASVALPLDSEQWRMAPGGQLGLTGVTGEAFSIEGGSLPAHAGRIDWTLSPTVLRVSFDPNGGQGSTRVQRVDRGASFCAPACAFSKAGARFLGWCAEADGEGDVIPPGDPLSFDEDAVLYAIWE